MTVVSMTRDPDALTLTVVAELAASAACPTRACRPPGHMSSRRRRRAAPG